MAAAPPGPRVTMERPTLEPAKPAAPQQAEALAYFISKASGNVFPVFKSDSLIGRYDSVTGQTPEVDLTHEDSARNISRRHARIVVKDGKPFVAEEIGTMNGTYLNGTRIATGVLTPIKDGDELTLCRLGLTFRLPTPTRELARSSRRAAFPDRLVDRPGLPAQLAPRPPGVERDVGGAAVLSRVIRLPAGDDAGLRQAQPAGDPQAQLVAADALGAAEVEAPGEQSRRGGGRRRRPPTPGPPACGTRP